MKSGFVSLIGRTNAGKSSVINALLDEKIALVSHKQNATRRKIKAIVMNGDDQIIFIDTPGLHKSEKMLNQMMIDSAMKAIKDCDLIVFVASVFDKLDDYKDFLSLNSATPHIILLNKIDLTSKEALLKKLSEYAVFSENFKAIIPFSCKKRNGKKLLLDEISKHLPQHEHFYDADFLTPAPSRELYRDFILESIFENVSDELPYSSEAHISSVKEKGNLLIIHANIITDTNSHKAILIGKDGLTLKRIGKDARKKIENLEQKKVLLKLFVQVKKGWQKDADFIKKLLGDEL